MAGPARLPQAVDLRAVLLCAAGFAAAAAGIHGAVGWRPHLEGYTEKIEFYRRHGGQFSVVFLGSSRTHSAVVPQAFDQAAAEGGAPSRSFNLAFDALKLGELRRVVEEVLRGRPAGLRHVVLEPAFQTGIRLRNLATERTVYFHDYEATRLEVLSNLRHPRLRRFVHRNVLACAYHYANFGMLASRVFPPPESRELRAPEEALARTRGFRAMDAAPTPEGLKWHAGFLRHIETRPGELKAEEAPAPGSAGRYLHQNRALLAMARDLRSAGVQVTFLVPPTFHERDKHRQFVRFVRREAAEIPVLSYLDGAGEIYDPRRYWWDIDHLNGRGARIFSERLGRDFARLASPGPSS